MVSFSEAWKVLILFLIPIGGGIPAGVLLAKSYNFAWPWTAFLYLISDVMLALAFEPLLLMFQRASKHIAFFARFSDLMKLSFKKTTAHFGNDLGPLALVMISFGVDPMTGRATAMAAGHGFLTGWMIAIAGDMIYFFVIMISTLSLNQVIGDGFLDFAHYSGADVSSADSYSKVPRLAPAFAQACQRE